MFIGSLRLWLGLLGQRRTGSSATSGAASFLTSADRIERTPLFLLRPLPASASFVLFLLRLVPVSCFFQFLLHLLLLRLLVTRGHWLSLAVVGALRTAADRARCFWHGFISSRCRSALAYSTLPTPSTSCFRILRLVLLRLITVSCPVRLLLRLVPASSASASSASYSHAACTPRRV